ncbi:MAG: hypothetical protein A3K19_03425 [Lentisphaerae bacterium RIFOXYB12_FULL_65_16]|nr:MAG: hypothetical protein A3K18_31600 [Lentisphaerae bacterium RIFOXYA12_64_32]OGV92016.1 MAG: hypothetical protein A3K19_03425 [Lentisphaerae bacterium RIFOXYB12_FULL_65_16]
MSVVATVAGEPISVDEFRDALERYGRQRGRLLATPAERRELLEYLIREQAVAHRAKAAGYDRDPELVAEFERLVSNKYREDRMRALGANIEVNDDEVRRCYDEHRGEYTIPERVRVALLFFPIAVAAGATGRDEALATATKARGDAVALALDVRGFGPLAQQYAADPARRHVGGDIGWLQRGATPGRWPAAVQEAAFALQAPGDVSALVPTEDGFYLIRLIAREPEQQRSLDVVKNNIRYDLLHKKRNQVREAFEAEVRAGLDIQINEPVLKSVAPLAGKDEGAVRALPALPDSGAAKPASGTDAERPR